MLLSSLSEELIYKLVFDKTRFTSDIILNFNICDIVYDSSKAFPETLFVALVGARADGHDFAPNAYEKGARVFVLERIIPLPDDAVTLLVSDTRKALARLSASFFSHPEKQLRLIGVTGTKGKSTVSEMIYHILNSHCIKTGLIGTTGIKTPDFFLTSENSTPESYLIYKMLRKMHQNGTKVAIVEVSSQAIFKERIHGLHFDTAVFTNLCEDHIGESEHPDFEHYKNTKKRLFSLADTAVLNSDDEYFEEFYDSCACPVITFSTEKNASVRAESITTFRSENSFGITFDIKERSRTSNCKIPLPGRFSASNALAAVCVCRRFGVTLHDCTAALRNVSIKGRFEIVPTMLCGATFVIDYAHNGESLKQLLKTVREYLPRRVILVFGSVGGRTKGRRREMACIANALADFTVITSDNPGFETPELITREIARYIDKNRRVEIISREEAVRFAVNTAREGDIVLFCGKGHEEYQLVKGEKLPFCERDIIIDEASKIALTV